MLAARGWWGAGGAAEGWVGGGGVDDDGYGAKGGAGAVWGGAGVLLSLDFGWVVRKYLRVLKPGPGGAGGE